MAALPPDTTKTTRRITVIGKPGDKLIIPKNVRIVSIAKDADINASSSCLPLDQKLAEADILECFVIRWAASDSSQGGTGVFGSGDPNSDIYGVMVGNKVIPFGNDDVRIYQGIVNYIENGPLSQAITAAAIPEIIRPKFKDLGIVGDRVQYAMYFKSASEVGPTIALLFDTRTDRITGTGSFSPIRVYAESDTTGEGCGTTGQA